MHLDKKALILIICSIILVTGSPLEAASVLKSINRTDETSRLQLFLRFDSLPVHELTTNGRRVDLILDETSSPEALTPPESDQHLIRMTSKVQNGNTVLSFYFRYQPQDVTLNSRDETSSLMIDVLLGNTISAMYPDLSTKLQGITMVERQGKDYTNPVEISDYAGHWKLLFANYESRLFIDPAPRQTLYPFPIAAAMGPDIPLYKWLPDTILAAADEERWNQSIQMLREQIEKEGDEFLRKWLLLTYAEALVRNGDYLEPHQLLQQIMLDDPETPLSDLAQYLFIYLQSVHEDPYLAYYELEELNKKMGNTNPFAAYFAILQAESALIGGRFEQAEEKLSRTDIAYSGQAKFLRLLRQADIKYLQRNKVRSLVSYLELQKLSDSISNHPMSLAYFADSLYTHHRAKDAVDSYLLLSESLNNQKQQDLALFRLAMSKMKGGTGIKKTASALFQIEDAYPGTEGAYRAQLKQIDLDVLSDTFNSDHAIADYTEIAAKANVISLREEASLKHALLLSMSDKPQQAIEQALKMLREFQSGALRIEAKALIIEQLPGVLSTMVQENQYIDALVLAKKNRTLFARGWVTTKVLFDLAEAYNKLGFFDRAVRTFQYIFDVAEGPEREQVYLPLITALYEDGQYEQVEDYADRFTFRYPDSSKKEQVFLLRIRSLLENRQQEQAALLLDSKDRPQSEPINLIASKVYFDLNRWQDVIEILSHPALKQKSEEAEFVFLLAESFFQLDQYQAAEPVFQRLSEEKKDADQIHFRLAQIALSNNSIDDALKRFEQLAEKGQDPLWKKLAAEEVAILRIQGDN